MSIIRRLFGRGARKETHPTLGRDAFCRVCNAQRTFSRCWIRVVPLKACLGCQAAFEHVGELYAKTQPTCPYCGENLEQPNFEYGLCDTCGSKFEFVTGGKPGLLPNKQQRIEMEKHGKSWTPEQRPGN